MKKHKKSVEEKVAELFPEIFLFQKDATIALKRIFSLNIYRILFF